MVYPRLVNSHMIIQEVLKGISGIEEDDVDAIFAHGILCNWWRNVGRLPAAKVPLHLTERNLYWHQSRYEDPDPLWGNMKFKEHTPFISTTAGSVERDAFNETNTLYPAWWQALRFATNFWTTDGWVFYCYAWILGRRAKSGDMIRIHHREHSCAAIGMLSPRSAYSWRVHLRSQREEWAQQ
jgi:hypothetical protein